MSPWHTEVVCRIEKGQCGSREQCKGLHIRPTKRRLLNLFAAHLTEVIRASEADHRPWLASRDATLGSPNVQKYGFHPYLSSSYLTGVPLIPFSLLKNVAVINKVKNNDIDTQSKKSLEPVFQKTDGDSSNGMFIH